MKYIILLLVVGVFISCLVMVENILIVKMNDVLFSGIGENIGEIIVLEIFYGLFFIFYLNGFMSGIYGFYVYINLSCMLGMKDGKEVLVFMVGGYFDFEKIGKYFGLYNDKGYLGDLSGLVVNVDGIVMYLLLVLCFKLLLELKGYLLMIYKGGDNYFDKFVLLGGGGVCFVCGVIEK